MTGHMTGHIDPPPFNHFRLQSWLQITGRKTWLIIMVSFALILFSMMLSVNSQILCGERCICFDDYVECENELPEVEKALSFTLMLKINSSDFLNRLAFHNLTTFKEVFIIGQLACSRPDLVSFLVSCGTTYKKNNNNMNKTHAYDDDNDRPSTAKDEDAYIGFFVFCFSLSSFGLCISIVNQIQIWKMRHPRPRNQERLPFPFVLRCLLQACLMTRDIG